ncbi:hypothetical protein [Aquimarina brevivitae]|uniref:SnoaL-like protein n=1 Tax=Aquimarina brevivitae TaxID=323412 RepID=A0A4Q7P0I8_9FLAO|nr:hypothetical protein [Aquimarina brevivitae]RZS93306.1 hypothetical protein EV197_1884 [Aquimarina brevivitae]
MKKILLLIIFPFYIHAVNAQQNSGDYAKHVDSVDSIINTLYEVISGEKGEERDWALFQYLFKPEAKLIPSGKAQNGDINVRFLSPQQYIETSGKWLIANGFFENEIHRSVDTYGNIAQVFSTYASFKSKSDKTPFMRGINSIQLLNDGNRWWIINVYWCSETPENPIPKQYLNE